MPQTRDITKDFTAAASGELIKDEFFTLAESVGALEIMDPKMDSGFLRPGETLDPEYDLAQQLSGAQVIGLMDQLFSSEAAWQQGHALAQTVLTCLYIDQLLWPVPRNLAEATFRHDTEQGGAGALVDVVLRAYCCAVVKTCDLIQAQVTSEQYYEEEDFCGHLYRRELLTRIPVPDIIDLLSKAEAAVKQQDDLDPTTENALLVRLALRRTLLSALESSSPEKEAAALEAWSSCLGALRGLETSSNVGSPIVDAFSPKVQRKLASSNPPRPVVELSLTTAFEQFRRTCTDAQEAFSVLKCTTGLSVLTFLLTYMTKKPQPNVYIRCLLQSLVYKNGMFLGKVSAQDFILRDLAETSIGDSVIVGGTGDFNEAPIASIMHNFAEISSNCFVDLSRCLCMNRSRMRRMLAHTLNDWENLQFEAEDVDIKIRPHSAEKPLVDRSGAREEIWSYPLSSWVYAYKLRQMEWIVQMGFELEVYLSEELSSMYWYLRYLCDTRVQHLGRIRTFTRRSLDLIRNPSERQIAKYEEAIAALDFTVAEAEATASFAEALCNLYQALGMCNLIRSSPQMYGSDDFRHNLRLKPFLAVSLPAVPSRDELIDALSVEMQAIALKEKEPYSRVNLLLGMTDRQVKETKKLWDWISKQPVSVVHCTGCEEPWRQKTKDVVKSIIYTGLAVASLIKAISKADEGPIVGVSLEIPSTKYHDWWVVPSIKTS